MQDGGVKSSRGRSYKETKKDGERQARKRQGDITRAAKESRRNVFSGTSALCERTQS